MTRSNTPRKSWLLMGLIASLMMFAISGVATAQEALPCNCELGTIHVGKVDCKIEVCIQDAEGENCVTVTGGSITEFKCHSKAIISIRDCSGKLVPIYNGRTDCVECICVTGCCLDACVGFDEKGCIQVKIGPSACKKKC